MADPQSPAARVARALAEAADGAGRRTPRDAADPDVPVAATVVLVRDGTGGLEVLMIRRPDRGSFGGAWVFPGGRLEPADGDPADEAGAARAAARREVREETGLDLDAALLVPLSRWDPPPGAALRIRTWFFITDTHAGPLALQASEVESAEWVRPADMLARHSAGHAVLYPPTFVTLHDLAAHPDARAAVAAAGRAGLRPFETVARRGPDGPLLLWQGDAAYQEGEGEDGTGAPGAASRHRLDLSRLPWVYTRSG